MCFNTKKIISVFLTIAILFSLSGISVLAEETETEAGIAETIELAEQTENGEETTLTEARIFAQEDTKGIQVMSTTVASGSCGTDVRWQLDTDGVLIISGTGSMNDYVLSGKNNVPTTPWYGQTIKNIFVQDGVTYIGNYAFAQLKDVDTAEIADTVVDVGERIFSSSSIKSVKLSDNMSISKGMFSHSDIESISLPLSVTEIPDEAFYTCNSLKTVQVSSSLKTVGSFAFYHCTSLESINLPDYVTTYSYAFSGCKNLISISEKASIIIIPTGGYEFAEDVNLSTNIIIPEGVDTIYNQAFDGCSSIKKIILPSTLKNIYSQAFKKCGITTLELPEGLEKILPGAFNSCQNLIRVEIPDSVTLIGGSLNGIWPRNNSGGIFGNCTKLEEVKLGKGFASCEQIFGGPSGKSGEIGYNYHPNLKSVIYPQKSTKTLPYPAFWGGCQHLYGWNINDFTFYYTGNSDDGLSYVWYLAEEDERTNITYIYEVNYEANGGELAPSYQPKFPGKNLTITTHIPKREGYTFLGWSKSSAATSASYKPGSVYADDRTITLYAVWKENDISVTGVTLDKSTLSLVEGSSETLSATVTPENAANRAVTWTSSNTAVAAFSNGVVTAKSAGTATITATTADGGYTASCTVTVTAKAPTVISVTGISLNKSAVSLEEGKTEALTATITPSNATNKAVSWKSSNTAVAVVSNGVVTAKSAGTATITATTADGGYTASCTVTVTAKAVEENAPKIKISEIKAKPGNEVDVTIELKNNKGFASMGIEVGYNKDIMTLTKVTPNTGVGGTFTPAQSYTVNPFNMGWDGAANITYNGTLATMTFKVADNAPDGIYPITLDYYKGVNGNYVDGDDINYDENFDAVGFVYVSGNVIVKSYIPGDINGDEKVNNKDATFLLRYLAGWNLDGINTDALDIDGSKTVNNKDATILLRYLAGWSVTLH